MNKKLYNQPQVDITDVQMNQVICVSIVNDPHDHLIPD